MVTENKLDRQKNSGGLFGQHLSKTVKILAGLYFVETLTILGSNFAHYFPALAGSSLPAVSGASIIALSFVFTASVFGCGIMYLWRGYEYARLGDEIEQAEATIVSTQAVAARIRLFKEKLVRESSLS